MSCWILSPEQTPRMMRRSNSRQVPLPHMSDDHRMMSEVRSRSVSLVLSVSRHRRCLVGCSRNGLGVLVVIVSCL